MTAEDCEPRACASQQEKPPQGEARVPQSESGPPLAATREKPMQQWRPNMPETNKIIFKKEER